MLSSPYGEKKYCFIVFFVWEICMIDRGEKIVSLAKEMLAARNEEQTFADLASTFPTCSIRTLCFIFLLGAFTAGSAVHLVDERSQPADRYERAEIEALVYYAAKTKTITADELRAQLVLYLKRRSLDELTQGDVARARDFLFDHYYD
jgi:hypothetical protein